MASTLAQQLQTLQTQRGADAGKKFRGKPSLLFDFRKAADVDAQTIYNIGCEGALGLCMACCAPSVGGGGAG